MNQNLGNTHEPLQHVELLYTKRGRRYHIWGNHLSPGEIIDANPLKAGTCQLQFCPTPGHVRYKYQVTPDTAAFVAAAEIARHAMEDAIVDAARSRPQKSPFRRYSAKQQELIEKFRADMAAEGAMIPAWWDNSSASDIAQAGIDAVLKYSQTE